MKLSFILIQTAAFLLYAYCIAPAAAASLDIQPICEIEAEILSIEEYSIKEDTFSPKVLTNMNLEIMVTKDGRLIRKGKDEKVDCRQYREGQKFLVSLIKERNFTDDNGPVEINAKLKGDILHASGRRKKKFQLTNVSIISE